MLRQVAEGVLIHESEFCQSNAVVVQGRAGVLLIDPGVHGDEMDCLATDLSDSGQTAVAGFSTHPHWDHLLWHAELAAPPRYGTARCAATARDRLSDGIDSRRLGIPEQVPLDLLGLIAGLPAETPRIPWDGPHVRIIEHQAHAPGHAALLIEERGVLVAGDMLSDVLIPMLDLNGTADPIEDYLVALRLLEGMAGDVDVFVPGHGSIGGADQVQARIDQDRAYVQALRDAHVPSDSRVGRSAKPGWEWVSDVHAGQLQRLARRGELTGAARQREDDVAAIGRLVLVQIDCHDPVALGRFWSQVLGVEIEAVLGDPPHYVNLGAPAGAPEGAGVAFQRVPERKAVKNRLHFDIEVDDLESATARIEALGGTRAPTEDVSEYGYHWRVMRDPDGNEFCLFFTVPR